MKNTSPRVSPLIEWLFRISLSAKGLLGFSQLVGAVVLWLLPNGVLAREAIRLARREISEDSSDFIANNLLIWAQKLGPASENFYMVYLFGHGALNFGAVLALLLHIRGAYHVSLAALMGFVAYQTWQYFHTYDPVLLILTVIDVFVIFLVIAENRGRTVVPSQT